MRRWIKRAGKIALGILAALPIVLLVAFGLAQTEFGKRQILAIAERSLSDTPMKLQAQALEGFLPFRIRLVGVSLSDAQGPWLTADHLALDWSPAALLARRVAISELSADRIVLARPPLSTPRSSAPQPSTPSSGPRPPRLPVAIDLERLSVEKLELGPTILGEPASFTVAAQAHLGELSQSLQASFDVKRTDRDLDHAALAFDYSPDADRLKLDLSVEEPQGGLITHLMGLAGTPNLAAEIHGNGPLADWQASGKVALDEKPLLNLAARSTGAADARAVSFTARADPAEFVPPDLAPLLEGGVTAEGVVHVAGPRQPIAIERLNVAARAGMVAVTGRIDPAGPLDLTLDLAPAELSVYAAFLPPDLAWASASARLRLTGTTAQLGTALDFSAQDLALSGNRIGATALHATADLDADRLRAGNIDVVLNATGITPSDPSLARFTQDAVLKFVGSADASGAIVLDRLTLIAGGSVLQASGTASNWGTDAAQASGKLDTADLAPLAALAGLHGAGAASINFDLQKTQSDYAAKLDAETRALSTGIAIADRLLGPTPALHLAVRHSGTAATIDQATLQAAKLGVKASGSVGDDGALDLKADADLADLGTVMTGGSGALAATATVTGTIAAPSAKLLISSRRLTMSSIELANLAAAIDASDFATRPKARLKATAAFADLPASLDGDVAFTPASNEVKVTGLDARLGQSILVGTATVKGTLADGDLALKAPDIAELSVLARRNLAGNAEVKVTFLTDRNRQNAELHATAAGLAIAGTKIESAKLDATGTDVLSANATLGADAVLSSIAAGGQAVGRVEARASGALANLAVTLDAASPEARLAAAATVKHVSEETGIALAKLDLTAKGAAAHLQHTAEITLKGPRAQLTGLAIAFDGGGALTLDAALGPQGSTADAKLAALPLGLAHAFSPDLDLTGVLDGALHLEGNRQAPAATLKLKGTGLAIKGASPSPVDLTLDAAWRGGVLDAKGRVALQKGGALDLAADLPVAADPTSGLPAISNAAPLRATAEGKLDLALLNAVIPGGADQVAGEASIDLSASGAVGAPVLAGKLTIANGAYENLRYGTRLRALAVTVEGNGTSLKITSLSAKTPDGGTIDGNG
ncbi:MAG TPA: hypothetical protein VMT54_14340, partial [Candidatus Cybelea sp.]|nr:hypothetical protein [Candidatus Cybelea sp.]